MVHNCHLGIDIPDAESKQILVFPNLSTGIFYLSHEQQWKIISSNGIIIKEGSGNLIDISNYATGFYILKTSKSKKAIIIIKK